MGDFVRGVLSRGILSGGILSGGGFCPRTPQIKLSDSCTSRKHSSPLSTKGLSQTPRINCIQCSVSHQTELNQYKLRGRNIAAISKNALSTLMIEIHIQ